MEGEWSCHGDCQFNGGRMFMLPRWTVQKKENCYGSGQFKRRRMVVTEVVSLIEGERSRYRGGHFNGGRMVTLQKWSL